MISQYPYELLIVWKNGKRQSRTFESVTMMMTAANSLRPALVQAWKAMIVLEERTLEKVPEKHLDI